MTEAVTMLSVIGFFLSVGGNLLIDLKKRIGFIVWTAGNAVWITVECLSGINIGRTMMFLVYAALNVYGWFEWKRE